MLAKDRALAHRVQEGGLVDQLKTKYCVKCGKTALVWCGHVLRKEERVMAGWCSQTCQDTKEVGFCGHYKKWMHKCPEGV